MSLLVRKVLVVFFLCFVIIQGTADAGTASYDDFIKEFYVSVSEGDFKTIFKHRSTSRFRSASDFASFKEALEKINADLGTIQDYGREYIFEDNQYQQFSFVRMQYRVKHEKGDTVQRFVLMLENGSWVLDGYAVNSNGQFLIARGNLYNFDQLDENLVHFPFLGF